MKVTNKLGLPLPLVKTLEAVSNRYSPGESDITATGLIEPPRLHALKAKHRDEITEDAADLIYSAVGTSIHAMLESAGRELEGEGYVVEKRFYGEFAGWKVGAQVDLFHPETGVLQDYKNTSVYAVRDGAKEEHVKQLNIGAELLRRNGYEVKKLQIVAILRDWSKGEYERDEYGKYPPHQVKVLDVPIIAAEEVVKWIEERVEEHRNAQILSQNDSTMQQFDEQVLCSPEERWAKPDTYAIIKNGQKKAYRVHTSEESAKLMIDSLDSSYIIVKRQGVSTRCELYCPAKQYCNQYKKMKE
jgi:hypothetical protein